MWLPLLYLPPGSWPATQACAPTGNQTGDPLVHRLTLNPLRHTSQGTITNLTLPAEVYEEYQSHHSLDRKGYILFKIFTQVLVLENHTVHLICMCDHLGGSTFSHTVGRFISSFVNCLFLSFVH